MNANFNRRGINLLFNLTDMMAGKIGGEEEKRLWLAALIVSFAPVDCCALL